MSERRYPGIPEPTTDVESLRQTVNALREAVQTLTGQNTRGQHSAVTWQDLVDLDLALPRQIPGPRQ